MKTHPLKFTPREGAALVIALCFITLLTALVIAWFNTTSQAMRSATTFDHSVSAERLADVAVNVVKGQIGDGTRSMKEGTVAEKPANALVWTSQPGLIRAYGTDGLPYRFYKLYSSDTMVVTQFPNGRWSPEENVAREVPDDWFSQPSLFTDLNAPSLFPLKLQPKSEEEIPRGAVDVLGHWYLPRYPIVDPSAQQRKGAVAGTPEDKSVGVEGFRFDATRVSGAPKDPAEGYNPMDSANGDRSGNPVPMPVRWLYVLRDGRLTAPERCVRNADGVDEVRWTPGRPGAPSRENPIVGRIAFWADDETCKLNVNTASEGVFWDRPCANPGIGTTQFSEARLATGIPRRDEWQRTPGHPAMTCLSPVLSMLPDFRVPTRPQPVDYAKFAAYYRLAPRIGVGGTEAGLIAGAKRDMTELDRDRLFASTDELAFTTTMRGMFRDRHASTSEDSFLEKAKFFLTTSNRAPETNVFNRPRISMWPVQQDRDPNRGKPGCPDRTRTLQDDRFAIASTLGGQPYYFQRYSAYLTGSVNDRYKDPRAPFGQQGEYEPPSSQRSDLDWRVVRNQQLYRYLRELTDRPIPGVSEKRTMGEKFGADRDQLLTSMVDLLRNANTEPPITTVGSFAYTPPHDLGGTILSGTIRNGTGQIVPLMPPAGTPGEGTKGFGRFPTITEAALVFYGTGGTGVGAMLLLEPFTPVDGPPTWSPLTRICIRGLDKFLVNDQPLDMPKVATNLYSPTGLCNHGSQAFLCHVPMYTFWRKGLGAYKTFGTISEDENYPFYSRAKVNLPVGATSLKFGGGKIAIQIHAGYYGKIGPALSEPPAETLVQTLELDFPSDVFPVPRLGQSLVPRLVMEGKQMTADVVIRSVEVDPNGPSGGDLRLVAGPRFVPTSYFHPHPDYHSTRPAAHSMRTLGTHHFGANVTSQLHSGFNYAMNVAANGQRGAFLKGTNLYGDWNSGTGSHPHGSIISVPDQGNGVSKSGGYYEEVFLPETGMTVSALRQLPSPVVFGSLPVGMRPEATQPWRTLLFCANPAAGKYHPGWQQPRDHYLLDLFQMPVVEPYPLSDSLSSAGKVNLNYQLVPFTYIVRDTALRGAFRSTKVTTLLNSAPEYANTARLSIDADQTLKGFERRFANDGGCFKTASELCEMFLVPEGAKLDDMKDGEPGTWWWKRFLATGDNLRESPYNHLYSRITSRSNTFTVHYRVQVLAAKMKDPCRWIENPDFIARDARGAATIEQYIDPEAQLPDFATNPAATLDEFYKFRIVRTERFAP